MPAISAGNHYCFTIQRKTLLITGNDVLTQSLTQLFAKLKRKSPEGGSPFIAATTLLLLFCSRFLPSIEMIANSGMECQLFMEIERAPRD